MITEVLLEQPPTPIFLPERSDTAQASPNGTVNLELASNTERLIQNTEREQYEKLKMKKERTKYVKTKKLKRAEDYLTTERRRELALNVQNRAREYQLVIITLFHIFVFKADAACDLF